MVDIRVAAEDALAAAEHEDIERRLREAPPNRAHQRGGEQHVAEPPQGDDQDARAPGQIKAGHGIRPRGTSAQELGSESSRLNDL